MARARNIKPGLLKNEVLGVADPLYTLLFVGLWTLADREGRLEDRPLRVKGEVFPYRDGIDVAAMLAWLEDRGFIQRYAVGNKSVIQILQFAKHQTPHGTEKDSELPDTKGLITVHKRGKNGYATGEFELVDSGLTVKEQKQNTLIPDSGYLIPDSLIPDHSVPNGTGAAEAPPADDLDDDPKLASMTSTERRKTLAWRGAKSLLNTHGMPKDQTGAFLGKLHRDYRVIGDDAFLSVLESAVVYRPDEPEAWIAAAMQRAAGNRKSDAKSFRERDREAGMLRWEQMTGQVHPDRAGNVIDMPANPAQPRISA
jgi:hypothetical protein